MTHEVLPDPDTAPDWAVAWKYEDPTEGARWVDAHEAAEIEIIDPSLLIWVVNRDVDE